MRMAALVGEHPFRTNLNTSLASDALTDFYAIGANRFMLYLCMTLLAGLATWLALEIYGVAFQQMPSPLAFRGVYAWDTALNFGICQLMIDEVAYRLGYRWPMMRVRTIGWCWVIGLIVFAIFMMVQRTLVYERTIYYHPNIVTCYRLYPEARPGWISMTAYCVPFWLSITGLAQILIFANRRRFKSLSRANLEQKRALADAAAVDSGHTNRCLQTGCSAKPLVVNCSGHPVCIRPEHITHVSVEDHYCRFFLNRNGETEQVFALTTLRSVKDELPAHEFLQIHRSHLVRLDAVCGLQKKGRSYRLCILPDHRYLAISRQRLSQCLDIVRRHLSGVECHLRSKMASPDRKSAEL